MKMIKFIAVTVLLMGNLNTVFSQKYFTKEGNISFYSKAPLEDIEAHNEKATAVIDFTTGEMEWATLIKAFKFKKALMQEHFNENYMESNKYPKATFKGKIENYQPIDFNENGSYELTVGGDLTIHGVTRPISAPIVIKSTNGKVTGTTEFVVKVQDYKIEIPSIVRDKIAKEIKVSVQADLQPLDRS